MDIYSQKIIDNYKNPKNKGILKNHDVEYSDANLFCGDTLRVAIKFGKKKNTKIIKDIKFEGNGCAISIATASMLTEHIKGKSVEVVKELSKEDVIKMLGIDLGPVRIKCALLALKVIKFAVYKHEALKNDNKKVFKN